ncbi:MAG: alpha/beta hydrolase [Oscillospiraceae bacterium]|nr:alpha/beta hydrolase [Oscillospiraceae bacterium]
MNCTVRELPVYYEEYGEGTPVLCIHGYWVDHRLMSGCLEPIFSQTQSYRRIYVDLPGMGKTPSARWIQNARHTLEILTGFIQAVLPEGQFLVIGESFGGYLTLGLTAQMPDRINGIALLCPGVTQDRQNLPEKQIIWKSPELGSPEDDPDLAAFLEYAVIAAPETYRRYKSDILSGIQISDTEFLSNYFNGDCDPPLYHSLKAAPFHKPSCIITGRQDQAVGYSDAFKLVEMFPRATYAAVDCAGHNLQIDNEPLFAALIMDWIWRVELQSSS